LSHAFSRLAQFRLFVGCGHPRGRSFVSSRCCRGEAHRRRAHGPQVPNRTIGIRIVRGIQGTARGSNGSRGRSRCTARGSGARGTFPILTRFGRPTRPRRSAEGGCRHQKTEKSDLTHVLFMSKQKPCQIPQKLAPPPQIPAKNTLLPLSRLWITGSFGKIFYGLVSHPSRQRFRRFHL
jgi:hypothetical protein